MTAPKATNLELDLTKGEMLGRSGSADDDDRAETIDGFLDQYGSGAIRVSVYRVHPKTAKLQWCAHFLPDSVNEEVIRDEFGPGSYVLKLLDEAGKFLARKSIDIAELRAATGGAPVQGRPGGIDPALQLQIENMRDAANRQHELLVALISKNGGGGGSLKDMLEVVTMLRSEVDPIKNAADILKLSRDLAPATEGNGDGSGSGWAGVVRDVAPALLQFLPHGNSGAPAPAAPRPPVRELPRPARNAPVPELPAGAAPDPQPAAPPQDIAAFPRSVDVPENPPAEATKLLRAQLDYWKTKARAGAPVDFWVDYVFLNASEPPIAAVLWAVRHYSYDQLASQDPELAGELRPWFLGLYHAIHAELFADDDMAGEPGDVPDAPGHAGARTDGGGTAGGEGGGDSGRAEPAPGDAGAPDSGAQ